MRSRLLIGGLCVAVALVALPPLASAQGTSIDRAHTKFSENQTKMWTITLDTSLILRVRIVLFQDGDPDIIIFKDNSKSASRDFEVDEDDDVFVDSRSGANAIEEATAGLPGNATYTIAVTLDSKQTTDSIITFETFAAPGISGGPGVKVVQSGQFRLGESLDGRLGRIQDLVRKQREAKQR